MGKRRLPPIWIESYGCTLNHADTDIMRGILEGAGYSFSPDERDASIVILNTCSVKEATENKIISRMKRLKDGGKRLVVAGCLGINEKRVREADPGAAILLPAAVSEIVRAVECARRGEAAVIGKGKEKGALPRAYTAPIMRVAVQEGCVGNCHFCHTKLARPELRSLRVKEVRRIVETAVAKGAREVQVTGQDTGAYGMDIGSSLPEMLREALSVEGDFMVRLGMINPSHAKRLLPELLKLLESRKLYTFLHLPVQTGSEKVRREMNRAHTIADFEEVVRAVRGRFPDASISTDIIVGYPTETRGDFGESAELLGRIGPDVVNLSKFSSRRGTKASRMKKLPTQEVKARSSEMSREINRLTRERNSRYVGRVEDVLITEMQKTPTGRMGNYKQVCVEGGDELLGKWVRVKIVDCNHGSLFGELLG